MNEKYNEPELEPIDSEFGTGRFLNWADMETKTILITNWGQYMKQVVDKEGEEIEKSALRATVLNVDGKVYNPGEKILDSTSVCLQKAIKPFLIEADKEKRAELYLRISRKGTAGDTVYFIEKVELPRKSSVEGKK